MSRTRSRERFEAFLDGAASVFMEVGYQRAKMAHIARRVGAAPGTFYLYFEGKESLFDTVVRRGFLGDAFPEPSRYPVPPEPHEALLAFVRSQQKAWRLHEPGQALARRHVPDAAAELKAVIREVYALMARYATVTRIIERSALDWPALHALHERTLHERVVLPLTRYLQARTEQGLLAPVPDAGVAARMLVAQVVWATRQQPPATASPPDDAVRRTTTHLLVHALTRCTAYASA